MPIHLLLLCVAVSACCQATNAIFQKKAQSRQVERVVDSVLYTLILSACQSVILAIVPPYNPWPSAPGFYGYTTFFSVLFYVQMVFHMLAFRLGPATLTSTLRNLYTLVPIILGLFLWNDPLKLTTVLGVGLFLASLFLNKRSDYSVAGEQKKTSPKWLFAMIGLIVFAGLAASTSKQVMLVYEGVEKTYLLLYNLIVLVLGAPLAILYRKRLWRMLRDRRFLLFVAGSSLCLCAADLLYVYLVARFTTSFYMPLNVTSVMVAVLVFSRVFLKEKISRRSLLATSLCVVAVVILAL